MKVITIIGLMCLAIINYSHSKEAASVYVALSVWLAWKDDKK